MPLNYICKEFFSQGITQSNTQEKLHKEHSLDKLNLDTSIYSFIKEMMNFFALLALSSSALRKKTKKNEAKKTFFFPFHTAESEGKEVKCACNVCNFMREHVAIIIQFSSCCE